MEGNNRNQIYNVNFDRKFYFCSTFCLGKKLSGGGVDLTEAER